MFGLSKFVQEQPGSENMGEGDLKDNQCGDKGERQTLIRAQVELESRF